MTVSSAGAGVTTSPFDEVGVGLGAWATDQALPSRWKNSAGSIRYFEYTSVWMRNRSSGYRRCSRSSSGIWSTGVNRFGNALRHAARIGS